MTAPDNVRRSFVLLHLAGERFALPAQIVAELAPPVRLHSFPHSSPLLSGVIMRRGRILPVYDVGRALSGKQSYANRFYLVAKRQFGEASEMSAIPVEGECELISSEMHSAPKNAPAYVCGQIALNGAQIGVLDFEALVKLHSQSHSYVAAEAQQ